MTMLHERTPRGRERYAQALAYVWGREDAGDCRLKDALRGERDAPTVFAGFAADEADAYAREERCSLGPIVDQYASYVAAHTPGSRFVNGANGDVFRVDSYRADNGVVIATVVDGPHGCPSTVPIGGRVSFTPDALAGYRLLEPAAAVQS